ncbi:hypothetical protein [Sulfurimicrobium lacus]|uniref:hypothetical protein n=1 Tax=Sulfurimicrobium lacus TaxID=2715678 RepID=UPI001565CB1F|nr:hypothetical protein [Sulfurimicrobium lacus]
MKKNRPDGRFFYALEPGITWQQERQEQQRQQQERQEQQRQQQERQEQQRQRQERQEQQVLQQQERQQQELQQQVQERLLLFCRKRTGTGPTEQRSVRSVSLLIPFLKIFR